MPNRKISDLDGLVSIADDDFIMVVDKSDTSSAATGTNKKAEASNVATYVAIATQPLFDVRWYGATGDGSTDDTTAIQAAFTAIAGGGKLTSPPNLTFRLTDTIAVTRTAVGDLVEVDFNGSLFQWDGAAVAVRPPRHHHRSPRGRPDSVRF